jgi:hypothetical protein
MHAGKIAGAIVNGREMTGITTWQSGFPFTVYSGVDNSFTGIDSDRADFHGSTIGQASYGSQAQALMIQ